MPLIAMTREMGSLGAEVARGIGERLGRSVVYHELIASGANRARLRKTHVERYLDGESGLWERIEAETARRSMYTAAETCALARDAAVGVIRGWGAAQLLRPVSHVLRVRVCAPLELRVERVMRRLDTDNREAVAAEIALAESAHASIVRRHFGMDWRNPELYDATLCTERLTIEECVDELAMLIARPAFAETESSRRALAALEAASQEPPAHADHEQGDYIGNALDTLGKVPQP